MLRLQNHSGTELTMQLKRDDVDTLTVATYVYYTSMSEQFVRCLVVEEGGIFTLPLTSSPTILHHCNYGQSTRSGARQRTRVEHVLQGSRQHQ